MNNINLPQEFDAKVWVSEWMRITKENPGIPTDEGAMLGWFANAIMAGYDHYANTHTPRAELIAGIKRLFRVAESLDKSITMTTDYSDNARENYRAVLSDINKMLESEG